MKFSTKVIIAVYVTLILFTITMIALFLIKGSVPDSLITCVFAACSVKYGDGNNEDINISDEDGEDNE